MLEPLGVTRRVVRLIQALGQYSKSRSYTLDGTGKVLRFAGKVNKINLQLEHSLHTQPILLTLLKTWCLNYLDSKDR